MYIKTSPQLHKIYIQWTVSHNKELSQKGEHACGTKLGMQEEAFPLWETGCAASLSPPFPLVCLWAFFDIKNRKQSLKANEEKREMLTTGSKTQYRSFADAERIQPTAVCWNKHVCLAYSNWADMRSAGLFILTPQEPPHEVIHLALFFLKESYSLTQWKTSVCPNTCFAWTTYLI